MAEAMIEAVGLRAGYGGTPILQGIDFSVARGEIVAIIGRNGVGKTTLMKCLMGLLPATAGEVKLREAFTGWLQRRYALALDPATQVLPVNGTREALFAL